MEQFQVTSSICQFINWSKTVISSQNTFKAYVAEDVNKYEILTIIRIPLRSLRSRSFWSEKAGVNQARSVKVHVFCYFVTVQSLAMD